MHTFEDLEVWRVGREIRNAISDMVKSFPKNEQFRLTDQMVRASRSVTANIAEGYGRFYHKENIQYCRQARGSLLELVDHLSVAQDENYISIEICNSLKDKILHCNKILNGYIMYLNKSKPE